MTTCAGGACGCIRPCGFAGGLDGFGRGFSGLPGFGGRSGGFGRFGGSTGWFGESTGCSWFGTCAGGLGDCP